MIISVLTVHAEFLTTYMNFAMISRLLGLRCLMSLEDVGTGRDCSENTRHVEDGSGYKLVLSVFLSEYKK